MLLATKVAEIQENGLCAVKIEGVELFDVGKTFDCGQSFRFDPVSDTKHEIEFAGCAHGKYISVAQDGDTVYKAVETKTGATGLMGLFSNFGGGMPDFSSMGGMPDFGSMGGRSGGSGGFSGMGSRGGSGFGGGGFGGGQMGGGGR